jgi:hypothetical protein
VSPEAAAALLLRSGECDECDEAVQQHAGEPLGAPRRQRVRTRHVGPRQRRARSRQGRPRAAEAKSSSHAPDQAAFHPPLSPQHAPPLHTRRNARSAAPPLHCGCAAPRPLCSDAAAPPLLAAAPQPLCSDGAAPHPLAAAASLKTACPGPWLSRSPPAPSTCDPPSPPPSSRPLSLYRVRSRFLASAPLDPSSLTCCRSAPSRVS